MKKLKIVPWVILIVLGALLFYQNWEFFQEKQILTLDIWAIEPMNTPEWPIAVWFLTALCIGFLIAYVYALVDKMKKKKILKALKVQTETQLEMISQLKNELETHTGFQTGEVMDVQPIADGNGQASEKI